MSGPQRRAATVADVARAAGVSTATVSRALRNQPGVDPTTRDRVLQAARELDYTANPHAARLASGATRTVALVAPVLTSWYTSEVVAGVEEVLAQQGYDLLIGASHPLATRQRYAGLGSLRARSDGIVLVDPEWSASQTGRLAGTPTVVVGERVEHVSSISIDNERGGRLAGEHLITLGHRRVAVAGGVVRGRAESAVLSARLAGLRSALRSVGAEPVDVVVADLSVEGGLKAMRRLLERRSDFTAVFAISDELAFGCAQALREHDMPVPGPIALVGFDDHPVAGALGLTTVRQPVREMGRLAARSVLDQIARAEPSPGPRASHRELDVELVTRASSTAPS